MKRKYKYLISYNYKSGRGTAQIILKRPIASFKQINDISEMLGKDQGVENILIENYILVSKRDMARRFI